MSSRLKKAIVLNHVGFLGGAEVTILQIISRLKEAYEFHVITYNNGEFVDKLREMRINVTVIEGNKWTEIRRSEMNFWTLFSIAWNLITSLFKTSIFLFKYQPDLIVTNTIKTHLIGALLKLVYPRCNVIWRIQDDLASKEFSEFSRFLFTSCQKLTAKIICVSEFVKETAKTIGIDSAKLVVVHNGVEIQGMEPRLNQNNIVFAMVGWFYEWKGQDIVLDAWKSFLNRYTGPENVKLVFIGAAPPGNQVAEKFESNVKNKVVDQHIPRVEFWGVMDKPIDKMHGNTVLIHSSKTPDPYPTVVLEALSRGFLVIGADSGGVPEMIINNKTGLLFETGSSESLASAMMTAVDRQVRESIRARGFQECQSRMSLARQVELFGQVLSQA